MKKTFISTLALCTLLIFSTCNNSNDNDNNQQNNPETEGIGFVITNDAANTVYASILETLNGNSNIGIVAEVNHSTNAQNANLELSYTRTVYFGNPALGTPLMQANSRAGLDLPQRITVYTDEDGNTVAAYNSIAYLINRHSVENAGTTDMIAGALSNIINTSTDKEASLNTDNTQANEGIATVTSTNDFDTTYANIIAKLNAIEAISIIAELDHKANAQSVGMDLNSTKLIIFGNPALGTPLMQSSRTMALDLPQKILVYQNSNGDVNISYNDPYYLAERHNVENNDDKLMMISQALQTIAASGSETD